MKSGDYTMRFNCDGFSGLGRMRIDGVDAKGGDETYDVRGQITEIGTKLIGAMTIALAPGVSGNARIQGLFACPMTGVMDGDRFVLYGLGPLGLIIEIDCQWAGAVTERAAVRALA